MSIRSLYRLASNNPILGRVFMYLTAYLALAGLLLLAYTTYMSAPSLHFGSIFAPMTHYANLAVSSGWFPNEPSAMYTVVAITTVPLVVISETALALKRSKSRASVMRDYDN